MTIYTYIICNTIYVYQHTAATACFYCCKHTTAYTTAAYSTAVYSTAMCTTAVVVILYINNYNCVLQCILHLLLYTTAVPLQRRSRCRTPPLGLCPHRTIPPIVYIVYVYYKCVHVRQYIMHMYASIRICTF